MKFGRNAMAMVLTLVPLLDSFSNAFVSLNNNAHTTFMKPSLSPLSLLSPSPSIERKSPILSSTSQSISPVQTTDNGSHYSNITPEFAAAKTQVLAAITQSTTPISPAVTATLTHFINEYFLSCNTASLTPNSKVTAATTTKAMTDVIKYGFEHGFANPYPFSSTHKALRGVDPPSENGNTVDYYRFGVNFFQPCMDVANSVVLGQANLDRAIGQLKAGENVIFLANHQSEADPQVVSVAFDKVGYGLVAEEMVYVAGHKVTTDPLAVPFSMGRNLICIHSKKHINADAETKGVKMKQNLQAMGGMLKMLGSEEGVAIWVAPSGGRDRRDLESGDVPIAEFDQKTIDMFRLLGNKSKKLTHFYSLSMLSYDLCPPPDVVEAGVGEQRNVRFVPVGVSVSDEVIVEGGLESREEFAQSAFERCGEGYDALIQAFDEMKGKNTSQ